jgi:hypothetical protein
MRYYIDSEFIEDGKTIDLISIAVVAEDGRELYLVSSEFDESKASDWVRENVFPHIEGKPRVTRSEMRDEIVKFVGDDPKPSFWGYYCAYDWVAFCQLFGRMIDLPKGWRQNCRDLKQALDDCGLWLAKNPGQHDVLIDARWIRDGWQQVRDFVSKAK